MPQTAEQDYFLMVNMPASQWDPNTHLLASGRGNEVLGAMARSAVYLVAEKTLPEYELHTFVSLHPDYQMDDPSSYKNRRHSHDMAMLLKKSYEFYFYGCADQDLNEKTADLVRQGVRTPEDVVNERVRLSIDKNLISQAMRNWFNADGQRIYPEYLEDAGYKFKLAAPSIHRNRKDINPTVRQAINELIPKDQNIRALNVIPLRRKGFHIDHANAFYGGKMLVHTTFGYMQGSGDKEVFVPVVTELSPEHPARQTD